MTLRAQTSFERLIAVSRTAGNFLSSCFSSTFGLSGASGCNPPGATASTMTRNRSESLTRLAWRRVACCIYLPGIGQHADGACQLASIVPRTSMPRSKRTRSIMSDSTILQRNARPIRYETAAHLFTTGQTVRLKGGFGLQSQSAHTYRITAHAAAEKEIHNNIACATTPKIVGAGGDAGRP